jgi:AcrR family transcriptional regulator
MNGVSTTLPSGGPAGWSILGDTCQRIVRMRQNSAVPDTATGRDAQRRKTRARVLDAAIVEFQRAGANAADINAIVEAAGVARSTFYFHFPTKEHVLLELIRRDEDYLAEELGRFLDTRRNLRAVLEEIIRLVLALESRWGAALFRDVVGLYFAPAAIKDESWIKHPTFLLLAAEIERARNRGELYDDVTGYESAAFFLIGVHAQLVSAGVPGASRDDVLKKFVTSTLRSLQR